MGMTINLVFQTNTYDESNYDYDDAPQGSTFKIIQIYEVLDGEKRLGYFKSEIELDSYGRADSKVKISIVEPKTVTKTVWN